MFFSQTQFDLGIKCMGSSTQGQRVSYTALLPFCPCPCRPKGVEARAWASAGRLSPRMGLTKAADLLQGMSRTAQPLHYCGAPQGSAGTRALWGTQKRLNGDVKNHVHPHACCNRLIKTCVMFCLNYRVR